MELQDSSISIAILPRAEAVRLPAVPVVQRPLPRLESLDSARLFAAAGVVWVHSLMLPGPVGDLGRFGTCYFALALVVFMIRHARRSPLEPYGAYAYDRVCRLTIPFIIWTCVGTMAYVARVHLHDSSIKVPRPIDIALATSSPLWFLHFALLLSVLGYPAVRWLARQNEATGATVATVCMAIGAILAGLPDYNFEPLGTYYYLPERIYEVLPCIFWGVAIEHYLRHREKGWRPMLLFVIGLAVLFGSIGSLFVIGFTICAKNLGGLGLMLAACGTADMRHWHLLSRLGRLSFGIYLIHPFAINLAHLIYGLSGRLAMPQYVLTFATAISISVTLAWALRRSAYTRWLVT